MGYHVVLIGLKKYDTVMLIFSFCSCYSLVTDIFITRVSVKIEISSPAE